MTASIAKKLTTVPLSSPKNEVVCNLCDLFGMCRVAGLNSGDDERLERIVSRRLQVTRGRPLFAAAERFQYVYAVKSGAFKSYILMKDGCEQIVDFHFPGELIGMEGMSLGHYAYAVSALEPGSVCRMRVTDLPLPDAELMQFRQRLAEALSRKMHHCQSAFLLIGSQSVERSLAIFLLNLSERFIERGLQGYRFRLPMCREDIANYLGIANETVSRVLSRMQEQKLITVSGRNIQLRDPARLRGIARIEA